MKEPINGAGHGYVDEVQENFGADGPAPAELMIDDLAGGGRDRDLAHEELTRPEQVISASSGLT